jgi:hypothetical protein
MDVRVVDRKKAADAGVSTPMRPSGTVIISEMGLVPDWS